MKSFEIEKILGVRMCK